MTALAEGDRAWAIPWLCCYEFLSVVTNLRIWKGEATTPDHGWRQFRAWTMSPSNPHNLKVAGSNPAPATKESANKFLYINKLRGVRFSAPLGWNDGWESIGNHADAISRLRWPRLRACGAPHAETRGR